MEPLPASRRGAPAGILLVALLGATGPARDAAAAVCDVEFDLQATPRNPVDGATITYTATFCDTTGFAATVFTTTFGLAFANFVPWSGEWLTCPTGNCTEQTPDGQMKIGRFDLSPNQCLTFVFTMQLQTGIRGQTICAQGQASLRSTSPPPSPSTCTRGSNDPTTTPTRDPTCVTVQDPAPGCTVSAVVSPNIIVACAGSGASLSAAGSSASGCPGGALSYQWVRNGVPEAGETGPSIVFGPGQPAGIYQFHCLVSCAQLPACDARTPFVTTTLYVPQATYQAPSSACTGQSVQVLVDDVAACTIDCGNGTPPVASCIRTCTYAAPGTYTIHATGDDGVCLATFDRPIQVISQPSSCIDALGPVCETGPAGPTQVPLTSCSGSGLGHQWTTSLGTLSSATSGAPTLTLPDVSMPTQVTVGLTVTSTGGCGNPATSQRTFTLNPAPGAAASAPATSCTGRPVPFTGMGSGTPGPFGYLWDFGDGATSTQASPTHSYSVAGPYLARLTVTDTGTGCSGSASTPVDVSPGPVVAAQAQPAQTCAGNDVQFEAIPSGSPGPFTHSWQFGDGGTSTAASPTHAYQTPGMYDAMVTVTDTTTGCATTSTIPVDIGASCCPAALPEVQRLLGSKTPTIADASFSWSAAAGATGYNLWAVTVKTDIPAARQPGGAGIRAVCAPTALLACLDAGIVPAPGGTKEYYQVRATCGGTEGP